MSAPMLVLLQLPEDEEDAVMALYEFAAAHPGVTIVTPHYRDEPWRADIDKGRVPGEGPQTSRVIGADWPSGLLAKLEDMFAASDSPPGGRGRDAPGGNPAGGELPAGPGG